MNTTKLLKLIAEMADEDNITIKNVRLYPGAVEINGKVKVKILPNQDFLVENRLGVTNGFEYASTMLKQVSIYLQSLIGAGDLISYKGSKYKIIKFDHDDEYYLLNVKDNTFNFAYVLTYEQLQEKMLDETFIKIKEEDEEL